MIASCSARSPRKGSTCWRLAFQSDTSIGAGGVGKALDCRFHVDIVGSAFIYFLRREIITSASSPGFGGAP